MDRPNEMRKRRQRAAYAEYVRLQWRLYGLAHDDPTRATLQKVVRAAERRWRSLMGCSGAVTGAPIAAANTPRAGRDPRGAVSGPYAE